MNKGGYEIRAREQALGGGQRKVFDVYRHGEHVASRVHRRDAKAFIDRSLEAKEVKERSCMTCGDAFMSEGIGNRLCPNCAQKSAPGFELQLEMML